MSGNKKDENTGLIIFALIVGTPIYLLVTFPLIFWLVFLPIAVFVVVKFVLWLTGGK